MGTRVVVAFLLRSIMIAVVALGAVTTARAWWAAPIDEVLAQPRAAVSLQELIADAGPAGPPPAGPVYDADVGAFNLVTYNTAGLPPFINGLNDTRHYGISWRLNAYDLALVQEDFFYHDRLTALIAHPFRSPLTLYHNWFILLLQGRLAPDGLHRFTSLPFFRVQRIPWAGCNGYLDAASDCLALKGFSVATHGLGARATLDVVNLHMEAGGAPADIDVRMMGLEQIRLLLEQRAAAGRAIIVAGDWNARWSDPDDEPLLARARDELGLSDVSEQLGSTADFENKIDRVLYRSGSILLEPVVYRDDSRYFLDTNGNDLSDHPPVSTMFAWAQPRTTPLPVPWQSATRLGGNVWLLVSSSGDRYLAIGIDP